MKLNVLPLSLIFFIVAFLFSCKKSDAPVDTSSNLVKTYIEDATGTPLNRIDTFNLVYDNQERLISMTAQSSGTSFSFQYNPGYVVEDIMQGSHLIIREYVYLNSNQKMDSTFQYNDTDDSTAEKYIYNATGKLTAKRSHYGRGMRISETTYYNYDAADNLVMEIDINVTGDTVARKRYDHNTTLNTNDFESSLLFFIPKTNKNLVSRETNLSAHGTIEYSFINHAYSFDNLNRVVAETLTDSNGNIVVKRYSFF
jgi:hypothetical protein